MPEIYVVASSVAARGNKVILIPGDRASITVEEITGLDCRPWLGERVTAIVIPMKWSSGAAFQSQIIPAATRADSRLSQRVSDEMRPSGLQIWGYVQLKDTRLHEISNGFVQWTSLGNRLMTICLSNPTTQSVLTQFLSEVMENFSLDGIVFDGQDIHAAGHPPGIMKPDLSCFCEFCRRKMKEEIGFDNPTEIKWEPLIEAKDDGVSSQAITDIETKPGLPHESNLLKFLKWRITDTTRSIGILAEYVKSLGSKVSIIGPGPDAAYMEGISYRKLPDYFDSVWLTENLEAARLLMGSHPLYYVVPDRKPIFANMYHVFSRTLNLQGVVLPYASRTMSEEE